MRALFSLFLAGYAFNANAQDIEKKELDIPATSNLYKYSLTYPKDYYQGGVGTDPVVIDVTGVKYISFENTTGTVNLWPSEPTDKSCDADGIKGTTIITGSKGMSGIRHDRRACFLAGVFISNTVTPDAPAETLNLTNQDEFTTWGFECQQVFFIGNGVNEKGEKQKILVPAEADKLYLGFPDGGIGMARGYDDNKGSIHTTVVLEKRK